MKPRTLLLGQLLVPLAGIGFAANRPYTVEELLAKAVEVQRAQQEAGTEASFAYELRSLTEKLDKRGDVKEVEEEIFEATLVDGAPYQRLVRKDGHALTEKERKKEAKREAKFRRSLRDRERDDDVERVRFDEELLSRYDFDLVGTRSLNERGCHVLSFAPKQDKLPNHRRIDRVLNKAEGLLWIDAGSYQIARIEFTLRDKVKLWWGMLGSVSEMEGRLERRPVAEQAWMPSSFYFYMKGRVLFRSLHFRQRIEWANFRQRKRAVETGSTSMDMEAKR